MGKACAGLKICEFSGRPADGGKCSPYQCSHGYAETAFPPTSRREWMEAGGRGPPEANSWSCEIFRRFFQSGCHPRRGAL